LLGDESWSKGEKEQRQEAAAHGGEYGMRVYLKLSR
jgi:hypothetical protein